LSKPAEFLAKQQAFARKSEADFKSLKLAAEKKLRESLGSFTPN